MSTTDVEAPELPIADPDAPEAPVPPRVLPEEDPVPDTETDPVR